MRWLYPIILICILYHVFVENSIRGLCVYSSFSNPHFLCLQRCKICSAKGLDFWGERSYHTNNKKHLGCGERAAFGVFCLTTVYPTTATGVHGNSGGKSAGKHLFPSRKGRKRPEISGNRYSQILWDSVEK